jgi:ribosomal protein S18 acetylase RimI-like enzyme
MECRRIREAPENLAQFVNEVLPGYEDLYGPLAATQYGAQAPLQLAATIEHPGVFAYAAMADGQTTGLVFARVTESRHVFFFFHVLEGFRDSKLPATLFSFAVADLTKSGANSLFTEYIPFCNLDLCQNFQALGFHAVDRQIMRIRCAHQEGPEVPGYEVRPSGGDEKEAMAAVLAMAYDGHPEKLLYEEVQSRAKAADFLHQCESGRFGSCPRDYVLAAWHDTTCVGLVAGAEVVAELGFVLHMAVLPEHRGQGVGALLLHTITSRFYEHGLRYSALGVTSDNPAVKLYERCGFTTLRSIQVHYRLTAHP